MKRLTRAQAIHQKCIDCCNDQIYEVKKCHIKDCPLWRYRMGHEEDDELKPKKAVNDDSI